MGFLTDADGSVIDGRPYLPVVGTVLARDLKAGMRIRTWSGLREPEKEGVVRDVTHALSEEKVIFNLVGGMVRINQAAVHTIVSDYDEEMCLL